MSRSLKYLLGLGLLLTLGAVGYFSGYRMGCDPVLHEAACHGDSMTWLKHDFHLTQAQYAAIEKIHREYTGTCDEHCRVIREAVQARDALRAARPADAEALRMAEERIHKLSTNCEQALEQHLERVAALMSPEDGACYLACMRPLLKKFDHSGAPELGLKAPPPAHEH